jgi:hypothetical protein
MSIITNALLLASIVMFLRLPCHGMVYTPVLVVGSRAERVRSQIPDVDLIQLKQTMSIITFSREWGLISLVIIIPQQTRICVQSTDKRGISAN